MGILDNSTKVRFEDNYSFNTHIPYFPRERSGSVVECLT